MTSPAGRTQENRSMSLGTPLGDDALMIMGMRGSDALGRLFEFELDLVAEGMPVDAKDILGLNVTVRLDLNVRDGDNIREDTRYFNGLISRFSLVSIDETKPTKKVYSYRATMVPALWMLTRMADCRIFQEMSASEIVQKIIKDKTGLEIEDKLLTTYRKREYCVQYRETDFNFISRLMEEEGIYYFFKHENGKHTVVLCDSPTNHVAADGYADIEFKKEDIDSSHDAFLWDWVIGHEIMPNSYTLTDYNFETPSTALLKNMEFDYGHPPASAEVFDYPGGYYKLADGGSYIKARLEELESQYAVANASSMARGVSSGVIFELIKHPECSAKDYLVTSVDYHMKNESMGGVGGGGGGDEVFRCQFTCIPTPHKFRSPRTTHKPIVQGPQTAVVVGPSGEEIYTDKYGRVKIQFFWDRDGKKDENSSCFVRVSQGVAGKGWGMISLPRKGQEVIVDFLEGDPDRPIITGRVYNAENMPPYALPANMTMSTFKSNTTKGGGGFNEIRFEDKKSHEQIFINAQKQMDIQVGKDRYETVGHDMHLTVNNEHFVHVKAKCHIQVDSDTYETVGASKHVTVGASQNIDIGGSQSEKIGGNLSESVGGDHMESVGGQLSISADKIILNASSKIVIKVGGHSICIGSDGIGIVTTGDLKTQSDGMTMMKIGTMFQAEAADIYLNASEIVTVQGGVMTSVESDTLLNLKSGGPLMAKGAVIMLN